jgi:hypothetical protein
LFLEFFAVIRGSKSVEVVEFQWGSRWFSGILCSQVLLAQFVTQGNDHFAMPVFLNIK